MKKRKIRGINRYLFSGSLLLLLGGSLIAESQPAQSQICGNDIATDILRKRNPDFELQLKEEEQETRSRLYQMQEEEQQQMFWKSTGETREIQIIFHIVLNQEQIRRLGGEIGIQGRVKSQLEALNRDWNAQNADSSQIPAPFKPLFGNMNIKFTLARVSPSGKSTPGYEITTTTKEGMALTGGNKGSTILSDAKYAENGGAAAWNPDLYYNVWVVNILAPSIEGGIIGGIATPPRRGPYLDFPVAEQGTAIHYGTFGMRTDAGQYFLTPGVGQGRTLVHETGHFFNLFHTWGNTENGDCSDDDGVEDTPLQGDASLNRVNPVYPILDNCSPVLPGIMFMNYMDYVAERKQCLFTLGQVKRVQSELKPAGGRYTLLQHSSTVIHPHAAESFFSLYPNPAKGRTTIRFEQPVTLFRLSVVDGLGRTVKSFSAPNAIKEMSLDVSDLPVGIYLLQYREAKSNVWASRKLVIY